MDLDDSGGSEDERETRLRARGKASLTLAFTFGSECVVLQLSKTYLPIYQYDGAQRTRAVAHAFAVVTATPVEQDTPAMPECGSPKSTRSWVSSNTSGASGVYEDQRPVLGRSHELSREEELRGPQGWDDAHTDDEAIDSFGPFEPGRPLYLFRDGSVVHGPPPDPTEEGKVSDVVALLESTDWSATPLGPRETWSHSLQNSVNAAMGCPLAAGMWWGKELTLIYNQLYADKITDHPKAFARSGPSSWAGGSIVIWRADRQNYGDSWVR